MSKAVEKAGKACPINKGSGIDRVISMVNRKNGYIQGYMQAEKDLALTIEDIELLHTFLYAIKNNKHGCFTFTRLSNEQYEEVLRRFRETKNK